MTTTLLSTMWSLESVLQKVREIDPISLKWLGLLKPNLPLLELSTSSNGQSVEPISNLRWEPLETITR